LNTAKKKTLDPTGISWPDGVRIKPRIVPQTIGKSTMISKIRPWVHLPTKRGIAALIPNPSGFAALLLVAYFNSITKS
jgi:hypothetical protein